MAYDHGPTAGLGHFRRMQVLATALNERHVHCDLLDTGRLRSGLLMDVMIVDAYSVRADELDTATELIVALDDLVRDLAVDVVVDPSPGASISEHPSASLVLAGAEYALVESGAPRADGSRPSEVGRILVTMGGADSAGLGAQLAARLALSHPEVSVHVVVGPWGSVELPEGVEPVFAPDGLAAELAAADLVVTAGGVTMLEAMQCGLPTVAVITAENQRRQAEGAAAAGGVLLATLETAHTVVASLIRDPVQRNELGHQAARVVDGKGPRRVAAVIIQELEKG